MATENDERIYVPGDVVETVFGVGVITHCPDEIVSTFRVMLWRTPGKSIGSCSVAFLQPNTLLGTLPAAPGMIATKTDDPGTKFMVHAYSTTEKMYSLTPITTPEEDDQENNSDTAENDENQTITAQRRLSRFSSIMFRSQNSSNSTLQTGDALLRVPSTDLKPAASAKFYPLLQELIKRGEQTAAVTADFLQQKEVTHVVEKATKFTQHQSKKVLSKAKDLNAENSVDGVATKVKDVVNEEEVQQLMTMIKDEDLTVLLQKGKERLEQLVQKDVPEATQLALEKTGIRVVSDDGESQSPYIEAIHQSRKLALQAMERVLAQAQVDTNDLEAIRDTLGDNFNTMFDSLTEAAKSDRTLSMIFNTINEKTADWQEMTGRLMQTRSASLFLEGASRIQARAKNLFSKDQLQWAGEIGSKFTKAFTEGDAAVARLKSVELGDGVRNRLVQAIEVRSESLGGLDGIIAGALTSMKGGKSGEQMKDMLTNLQGRATAATKDTHETLISVLARRSEYRDVALLKVEQVLCDLESQFGEDLSPQDIAAIASGEGGTAKLFEPIAKRAAKEIEKQLDAAEASVSDEAIIDVLKHVRKIVSGELTLTAVMDEVVHILNDDAVVAAGENLVKQGEQVLDAIEGVSGNKVVDDVMKVAERAGITKDTVMEGIESLDVNELLDNAGNAITDEKARLKLLSDATDTALDFILRILPSMPVPPMDGVKDGLVYHISNLSMEGFKVKKENIFVEIAGMRATKKSKEAKMETSEDGEGSASSASPSGADTLQIDFDESVEVKATELLIIDVSEISAIFNDAIWGFEQTYLPYLKGNGKFDVKMSNGAIRLVFELRKRRKESNDSKSDQTSEWEPVLCLHDRSFSIESVEFTMQGGSRLAWVVNKAASMFKGLLRDYVVNTILRILTDKSGWILSRMNEGLSPFWDVLLRTAKLEFEDLEETTQEDIVAEETIEETNIIELVWRERIPLGMNLLLNDESGLLKVVDFPRGSQARAVCQERNLDPEAFNGATIIAVNGVRYLNDDDLFEALRDPSRPKTVQFELAESDDAERIAKFVEESSDAGSPLKPEKAHQRDRTFETRTVEFVDDRDLGIEFANSLDNYGLVVRKFIEGDGGIVLAAARFDEINEDDLLTHINGKLVLGEDGSGRVQALKLLEANGNKRPLSLSFANPYLYRTVYEKSESSPIFIGSPSELDLEQKQMPPNDSKRIVVKGFNEVDGVAEKGGVFIGDHLVFINGVAVGAGCRWMGQTSAPSMPEVENMLKEKSSYPIGLTFARPQKEKEEKRSWLGPNPKNELITMENSETVCVTAETYDHLGLALEIAPYSEIVVKDLEAVPGLFQSLTNGLKDSQTKLLHLSIESVNGEFVPPFATTQMVKSAMDRSWKSENRVEILFCDDERKNWIHTLKDVQ